MSYKVANFCSDRLFGNLERKQIIMFLADKATNDGSGVFCSKGMIARHIELGGSTVKRVISEFVAEGILVETGSRPCTNVYTVIYRIDITVVKMLEPVNDPENEPRPKRTGFGVDGVPGSEQTVYPVQNGTQTIHKPPTRERAREAAVEDDLIRILTANMNRALFAGGSNS